MRVRWGEAKPSDTAGQQSALVGCADGILPENEPEENARVGGGCVFIPWSAVGLWIGCRAGDVGRKWVWTAHLLLLLDL